MTTTFAAKKSIASVCVPGAVSANGPCTVPCCDVKVERCQDGCKIYCSCDDEAACTMLQNLCNALTGGLCSVCCTMNGAAVCQCNFACCRCTCECTDDGVCITCCSGDRDCCHMIQALCDCIARCQDCGCTCTVCFNNTPVCCCTC